jgi:hypothetical protein
LQFGGSVGNSIWDGCRCGIVDFTEWKRMIYYYLFLRWKKMSNRLRMSAFKDGLEAFIATIFQSDAYCPSRRIAPLKRSMLKISIMGISRFFCQLHYISNPRKLGSVVRQHLGKNGRVKLHSLGFWFFGLSQRTRKSTSTADFYS